MRRIILEAKTPCLQGGEKSKEGEKYTVLKVQFLSKK